MDEIDQDIKTLELLLSEQNWRRYADANVRPSREFLMKKLILALISSCNFLKYVWKLPMRSIGFLDAIIRSKKAETHLTDGIVYTAPLEVFAHHLLRRVQFSNKFREWRSFFSLEIWFEVLGLFALQWARIRQLLI